MFVIRDRILAYARERFCVHNSVLALTHPFKNVSGRAEGDLGWGDHPLNSGRHCMGKNCGNQVGRKTYRKCAPECPANNRSWCPWEGMTR